MGIRECLAIKVDTSLPADRVIRVLERLKKNVDCLSSLEWIMARNSYRSIY